MSDIRKGSRLAFIVVPSVMVVSFVLAGWADFLADGDKGQAALFGSFMAGVFGLVAVLPFHLSAMGGV